jgi:hypothetical protein
MTLQTIKFEGIDLKPFPKLFLRVTSELADLGIKKCLFHKNFGIDTYARELTLIVNPYYVRNLGLRTFNISANLEYYNFIMKLKGVTTNDFNYISNFEGEPFEKIEFKLENTIVTLGAYFKNRNIILIYPNFLHDLSLELNNKYLLFFLDLLKEFAKKVTIEKVEIKDKLKEIMIANFNREIKSTINQIRTEKVTMDNDVRSYYESIINMTKKSKALDIQIESLNSYLSNLNTNLLKQLDEIKKLPFVKSARLTFNGIWIDIGNIEIEFEKTKVRLGHYKLLIRPNRIEIMNKTPLFIQEKGSSYRNTYNHPHVKTPDNICFGNRREEVYKLLRELKLNKLVYFLKLFLGSYNPNDKYLDIRHWIKSRQKEVCNLETHDIIFEEQEYEEDKEQEPDITGYTDEDNQGEEEQDGEPDPYGDEPNEEDTR